MSNRISRILIAGIYDRLQFDVDKWEVEVCAQLIYILCFYRKHSKQGDNSKEFAM